jgi:hypothetical protein
MELVVREEVVRSVVAIFDTVRVLTFSVEYSRLMALIVDAITVEFTVIILTVMVFPIIVLVFSVVMCIVEVLTVDTDMVDVISVLPTNVENPMFPPLITVEPIIDEIASVLP